MICVLLIQKTDDFTLVQDIRIKIFNHELGLSNKDIFDEDDKGATFHIEEIPAELQAEAEKWRAFLVEKSAEQCEELMEKYFEAGELTVEVAHFDGFASRYLWPVYCPQILLDVHRSHRHLLCKETEIGVLHLPAGAPRSMLSLQLPREIAEKASSLCFLSDSRAYHDHYHSQP